MKTLGVLAVLWMLYSMYRVFIKQDVKDDYLIGPSDMLYFGAFNGIICSIITIIYLIITYLP